MNKAYCMTNNWGLGPRRGEWVLANRHDVPIAHGAIGVMNGGESCLMDNAPSQRTRETARREALNRFLAGAERRAFRMAVVACGNREDAHEIVQDAMLNLVRRYASRPEDEWPLLFHRIMQNGIRDWHRRYKVRSQLTRWFGWDDENGGQEAVALLADPRAQTPDRDCESAQMIQQVERAVGDLPLRQKQAFLLRAWEGLDVRDTAQAMGCTEGSVKTHFSRAVRALRAQLGEVLE